MTGGNMCSLLKNTIIALSGLAGEVGFRINYDVNVIDLYRQFAISVVNFGALNVLLERNDTGHHWTRKRLPTWAPNWTLHRGAGAEIDPELYFAGGRLSPQNFPKSTWKENCCVLVLDAVQFDTIYGIQTVKHRDKRTYGTFQADDGRNLPQIPDLYRELEQQQNPSELLYQVWKKTIQCDTYLEHGNILRASPASASGRDLKRHAVAAFDDGRPIFLTGEGFIGIRPEASNAGDFIVRVPGVRLLVVLRPLRGWLRDFGGVRRFELLGPCYKNTSSYVERSEIADIYMAWNYGWRTHRRLGSWKPGGKEV